MRQPAEHLADDPHGGAGVAGPLFPQPVAQVGAVHQLHRQVQQRLGLADLQEPDDVRVFQFGQDAALAEEPLDLLAGGAAGRGQGLQRHRQPVPLPRRPVHHAHPAAAELALDAVPGTATAWSGWATVASTSTGGTGRSSVASSVGSAATM